MAVCIECHEVKDAVEFYAHKQMRNGHVNVCKECHKMRMKTRARLNPKVQEYDRNRPNKAERTARQSEYTKRWRSENPLAYRAHTMVGNAVRAGKLRKLPCEFCGCEEVHAHHHDYAKPLDVVWLCAKCHNRLHAIFPQLEGANKQGELA